MNIATKKSIFTFIILISIVLLIGYQFINFQSLAIKAGNAIKEISNSIKKDDIFDTSIFEDVKVDRVQEIKKKIGNLKIRQNNKWIVHENVLQYSAYGIFKDNKLKIESLSFLTYLTVNFYDSNKFNCVVSNSKFDNYTMLPITHKVEILPPLNKITCEWIDHPFKKDDDIYVGILYSPDFEKKKENSNEFIQFHKARIFNADIPKKKSISHCVHMFHGIESIESKEMIKFTNWVDIQKSIGYDHIRLYVFKLDTAITDYLSNKYKNYLTFVQHPTTKSQICDIYKPELDSNINSYLTKELYENCEKIFNKMFNPIEGGPHDRICMNDCYLNFKYEYELFTNYDIDEIIMPRLNEMDNLNNFESIKCNESLESYQPKYNMYDYGINLFNKFGRGNIACLMFKHVVLLPNGQELENFMNDLEKKLKNNINGSIVYNEEKQRGSISHYLAKGDFSRGKDVLRYHKLNSCLTPKYFNEKVIAEEFRRYFAIYIGTRWGKSISDTNLTETLNHHSCDTFISGSKFDLDLKYGYVSHFRTEVHGFLDKRDNLPFSNVFSDIEYYLFLTKILRY